MALHSGTWWIGGSLLIGGVSAWAGVPAWIVAGIGTSVLVFGLIPGKPPSTPGAPPPPQPAPVPPPVAELDARAIEHAGVALLAFDGALRLGSCNAEARALLGGRRVLGRPIDEVITPRAILDVCESCVSSREPCRSEIEWVGPDGPRTSLACASPIPGGGLVLTLHDVTEHANATRTRADFAANASHELRTPVAAIKLAIETMTGGATDDPVMQARLIAVIAGNVSRLEEVLNDLLDLSRAESPQAPIEPHPIDLAAFVRSVVEPFEPAAAERRLAFSIEVSEGLASFRTDGRLLRLILRNLIDNAVKFANDGTEVRVRASAVGLGMVRFEVVDKGVGIPLEDQPRIFERYFRVDRARTGSPAVRGSGLGLAIAKHAADRLRGTIRVSSVWKQGTTMTVEIPEAEAEGAS